MNNSSAPLQRENVVIDVLATVISLALKGFAIFTLPLIYTILTPTHPGPLFDRVSERLGNFLFAIIVELALAALAFFIYVMFNAQEDAKKSVHFRHPGRVATSIHSSTNIKSLTLARQRNQSIIRRPGTADQETILLMYDLGMVFLFIVSIVVGMLSCGLLMVPFWFLLHRFRRKAIAKLAALTAPTANMARAADNRAPVLLLRSFVDDSIPLFAWRSQSNTLEDLLEARLNRHGPVITLGRPGEQLPPTGAAREYILHNHWQVKITELLQQSRLVVLIAGISQGIGWELDQIVREGLLSKTIIVFPPKEQSEIELCWRYVCGRLRTVIQDQALNEPANGIIVLAFQNQNIVAIDSESKNGEEYIVAVDYALTIASLAQGINDPR